MPSANTVAQKPAGNVNPLSLFEHAVLLELLGGLSWFCAHIGQAAANNVANALTNKQGLYELNNRMVALQAANEIKSNRLHTIARMSWRRQGGRTAPDPALLILPMHQPPNPPGLPLAGDKLLLVTQRNEPTLAAQRAHLAHMIDVHQCVAVNALKAGAA